MYCFLSSSAILKSEFHFFNISVIWVECPSIELCFGNADIAIIFNCKLTYFQKHKFASKYYGICSILL